MDVRVRHFRDNCIIDVAGEIDIYNAHRLKDAVSAMMQKRICAFILNLRKVTYIDSSGIGALLSINAMLTRNSLALRIVGVPPSVMKVMQLTRLVGFLPVERTEVEALDGLEGQRREHGDEQDPGHVRCHVRGGDYRVCKRQRGKRRARIQRELEARRLDKSWIPLPAAPSKHSQRSTPTRS